MKSSLRALFTFLVLSFLGLAAQADAAQFEESTCALATTDFSSDSNLQIKVVSSVSNTTGYTSFSTLIHKDLEIRIGKTDKPKVFELANGPLEHRVRLFGRKAVIRFARQATISRGNAAVKVRQASLEVMNDPPKTLLCIYSTY